MKPIARIFEFVSYEFQPEKRLAVFSYSIKFKNAEALNFSEKIIFKKSFDVKKIPSEILRKTLESVHLMLGISYYKLYCPKKIKLNFSISKEQAEFWNTVYRKGLGEFFYRNGIDPRGLINFPHSKSLEITPQRLNRKNRSLVGIGGGKDSIVAVELLKEKKEDITAFLVETQKKDSVSKEVIEKMNIGSLFVERQMDEKIFGNLPGVYNGHIPISAVFAFLGYFTAIIYDYSRIIVGNEFSSNFGNIEYKGEEINHQWSKSSEFEELFQKYTTEFICPDVRYFSLLRPFYEIRIAKMFSAQKKYFSVFSSCNRNFRIHRSRPESLWCGECPKCVFVWTMLSAFLTKKELVEIFGKNLYADEKLLSLFEDISGFGKMKPFDCVGTFQESRAALLIAKDKFADSFIIKKISGKIKNSKELVEQVLAVNDAPNLPADFKFLGIENVLIIGYGREGKITEKYLKKNFPKLKIGIAVQEDGEDYLEKQKKYEFAIKTPGLSKTKVTIPYTTATNLFFSQNKNLVIGVTGSKGKSTTASLIHAILKAAGKKVTLLGNIGTPMLSMLLKKSNPEEIFVIELSSYQLDDICYSPHIAVVTNLFPEHMNYHGNLEKYYAAKKNIIKFQNSSDYFVYNRKDKEMKKWIPEARGKKAAFNNTELGNINIPLLGKHNIENVKAALKVAEILNVPFSVSGKAIENFKSLPHRLEFIGEFKGIKFYDDAISTAPESTIMALRTIPNVSTIFLGGEDRGYDFTELEKEIRKQKIKNIVLFPESGKRILKSRKDLNILETDSMEDAVRFAYQNSKEGEVCLLSTASPSYVLWKNFEEKGDDFQFAVKKLGKR